MGYPHLTREGEVCNLNTPDLTLKVRSIFLADARVVCEEFK